MELLAVWQNNKPKTKTRHLNYVAGYTDPLLFLLERTYNYYVDNHGIVPWRLRHLGKSKNRSARAS